MVLRLAKMKKYQNWPQSKKLLLLATVSFAAFASMGSPFVHLIALEPEAKLYGRTPTEIAWSVSIT